MESEKIGIPEFRRNLAGYLESGSRGDACFRKELDAMIASLGRLRRRTDGRIQADPAGLALRDGSVKSLKGVQQ